LGANIGNLSNLIDGVHFIAVAPDDNSLLTGSVPGWWLDSPEKSNYEHSRYLVEEIKPRIDSQFATLPGRLSTGVAGWSMGGFGALHNIIEHPDVYGSAFSIKGGVNPTLPISPNWEGNDFGLYSLLGDTISTDSAHWTSVNILNNIHRLKSTNVHLGLYGGRNDEWFAEENLRLDTIMTGLSMPHLFFETDEYHGGIPDSSMMRVLRFFDSVFVDSTSVRQRIGLNSQANRSSILDGTITWFDIRGRRLATVSAADKRYPPNASGVRIAVMPNGLCKTFFVPTK
jgi:esterase/lipase superfamily enzyme